MVHKLEAVDDIRCMLQMWDQWDDGSFGGMLRDREHGTAVSSEAMMNVRALWASQKMILWTWIGNQLSV